MDHRAKVIPRVLAYASREVRAFGSVPRIVLVTAWVYPLMPLAALYLTWLVAWVVLGHQPRSSLDDPKSISPVVEIPYLITGLLLITLPVGMLTGLAGGILLTPWWVHSRRGGIVMSVLLVAALLGLYAGGYFLLWWDPADVLYWYLD